MSLLRALERRERIKKGITENPHPKVLEGLNEHFYEPQHRYLHGRKGFRKISERRSRAALLTAEQKQGEFPPMILAWKQAAMFIKFGRWS